MYKLTESMSKCIIDTRPKSCFHFNYKETTLVANFLKRYSLISEKGMNFGILDGSPVVGSSFLRLGGAEI